MLIWFHRDDGLICKKESCSMSRYTQRGKPDPSSASLTVKVLVSQLSCASCLKHAIIAVFPGSTCTMMLRILPNPRLDLSLLVLRRPKGCRLRWTFSGVKVKLFRTCCPEGPSSQHTIHIAALGPNTIVIWRLDP